MAILLNIIRPYAEKLFVLAFAIFFLFGLYFYVTHNAAMRERQAEYTRNLEAYKASVIAAQEAYTQLEGKLTKAREENKRINEELQHEIGKHPVYHGCKLPAGGVQLLTRARNGSATTR